MNRPLPDWVIPSDLAEIIADEGMWETDHFEPILLTVLGDTVFQGRPIPLSWQIEFSPYSPEFDEANKVIAAETGQAPDAYAWCDFIRAAVKSKAPEYSSTLHTDDTEGAACVIWVESEAACKALVRIVWGLPAG